jgi:steroid delta-isomerase-like uncharacterized protein
MATTAEQTTVQELAEHYGDAWNRQDVDAIVSMHAEDGVFHLHAGAEPVQGIDAIRATFEGFVAQWPDIHFEPQRLIADGGGWLLASTMSGTLAQPLELEGKLIAEPGATIAVDALDVIDVKDGLVAAKHTYLDTLSLLTQIGWKP